MIITQLEQTKFGPEEGNCFETCIASVLGLDIDSVPDFGKDEDRWFLNFKEWIDSFYEMSVILVNVDREWLKRHRGIGIAGGPSPRYDCWHSVIYRNGKMVMDPHPDGTGLKEVKDMILFTLTGLGIKAILEWESYV